MPKKGHKSQGGVGDLYEEPKERTTLALTKAARVALDERANQLGVSRSELVERFARGLLVLPEQEEPTKKRKRSRQLSAAG
jgi:hypothetical protein